MIKGAKALAREHYATFIDNETGRSVKQWPRLTAQVSIALFATVISQQLSEGAVSIVVTSLSILAGFSFSAMFPIASDIRSGLQTPRFSEDKDDLERLSFLASSFRSNVSYFIPLTLLCIILFLLQTLHPSALVKQFFIKNSPFCFTSFFGLFGVPIVNSYVSFIFFCSVFIFFEVMYTFYRMCLTVLYILRIREEYRMAHEARQMERKDAT